ncbi:alpha/beta-hydrolase [Pluteus cervinus]|uniref:Alpha/beta-hydrolase n=1 Tax=Pluteus cervinus TaxID=181527 RepID=A0ACD3B5L1_9AGAR|nr:alpha/beta-hydrolase [Pluteus cervinus]
MLKQFCFSEVTMNGFDWRAQEADLNLWLTQFTRDIEVDGYGTLNIHYVHHKSKVANAIPLLFVHGWPGSFIEAKKVIPLLVEESPDHPSFHVVALSLPGFGFSTAPTKKGFKMQQYAEVCNKLMLSLGYNEYVTQGGDWGSIITREMAERYGGKHVKAFHTNFMFAATPHPFHQPMLLIKHLASWYTTQEKADIARSKAFKEGSGYHVEQSTKPQTIGYSLADSPVGLLAWIYEKLVSWTDSYPWTDDEVLTWISIYWFSRAGPAASVRIYYEFDKSGGLFVGNQAYIPTPHGVSTFPQELLLLPISWVRAAANVVFQNRHERGGHFAAYECPKELVGDVRNMFAKAGPAYGVDLRVN